MAIRSGVAVGRRIRAAVSNTTPVSSPPKYREESTTITTIPANGGRRRGSVTAG
jgi:hypothetical protein